MSIIDTISSYLQVLYDIDGNGKLEHDTVKDGVHYDEVGLFNKSLESYNAENGTIEIYNDDGIWVEAKIDELKNLKEKMIDTTSSNNSMSSVQVKTKAFGKPVEFTYNRLSLESYVINDLKDQKKKKITYYKDIPQIRAKSPKERTKRDIQLLSEFDMMISLVIKSGEDFGVDPKKILAIIEEECGGKGINENADGKMRDHFPDKTFHNKNGNGYMAITSVCIVDIIGGQGTSVTDAKYQDNKKNELLKSIISNKYGKEMADLLESQGYNLNITKASQKKALAKQIWKTIWDNTDPEFNIRMGTLILRYKEKQKNGDFTRAARAYNGNPNYQDLYSRRVKSTYDILKKQEEKFSQDTF